MWQARPSDHPLDVKQRHGDRAPHAAVPGARCTVPAMLAEGQARSDILDLIRRTYRAMSTPGSDVAAIFGSQDMAIAGSGQGELWTGPEEAVGAATVVSSWGLAWDPGQVTVWRRQDVAWAQILGTVHVVREGVDEVVPYWTTGVFGLDDDGCWRWLYWGGSEPQESAKV